MCLCAVMTQLTGGMNPLCLTAISPNHRRRCCYIPTHSREQKTVLAAAVSVFLSILCCIAFPHTHRVRYVMFQDFEDAAASQTPPLKQLLSSTPSQTVRTGAARSSSAARKSHDRNLPELTRCPTCQT